MSEKIRPRWGVTVEKTEDPNFDPSKAGPGAPFGPFVRGKPDTEPGTAGAMPEAPATAPGPGAVYGPQIRGEEASEAKTPKAAPEKLGQKPPATPSGAGEGTPPGPAGPMTVPAEAQLDLCEKTKNEAWGEYKKVTDQINRVRKTRTFASPADAKAVLGPLEASQSRWLKIAVEAKDRCDELKRGLDKAKTSAEGQEKTARLSLSAPKNCTCGAPCRLTVNVTNTGEVPFDKKLVLVGRIDGANWRALSMSRDNASCAGGDDTIICSTTKQALARGTSVTFNIPTVLSRGRCERRINICWQAVGGDAGQLDFGKQPRLLQFALRSAGFDPGAIDGAIGPRTRAAIAAARSAAGLPASDQADASL